MKWFIFKNTHTHTHKNTHIKTHTHKKLISILIYSMIYIKNKQSKEKKTNQILFLHL